MSEIRERLEGLINTEVEERIGGTPTLEQLHEGEDEVRLDLSIGDPFADTMSISITLDPAEAGEIDGKTPAQRIDDAAQEGTFDTNERMFYIDDDDNIHPVE